MFTLTAPVRRHVKLCGTAGLAGALVAAMLVLLPAAERAADRHAQVQREPAVGGRSAVPAPLPPAVTGQPYTAPAPRWPAASTVDVTVPAGGVDVPGLPVRLAAAGAGGPVRVRLEVLDRSATEASGVRGILLRVGGLDGAVGPLSVSVDYTGFRGAYGGEWASRLRLVPLSTPGKPLAGMPAPVNDAGMPASVNDAGMPASVNDVKAGVVTGLVTAPPQAAGGALVALAAEPTGGAGDFTASTLSPSATWKSGSNSGDFSWAYPLRVPPGLGGPVPKIEFGYSSSSVDGRMVSSNNQPSWLGEGFDWQPGVIERRYNGCAEDMGAGANNTTKTGDLCWETDNASLALSGHAGELIKDGGNPNRWHLRSDDGTLVERRTGAANGDADGEWWVVTATDGTQYWFGGRSGSNATLVVPVFGNHVGEPCHQSTFAASSCAQAYRWQLDRVVDPHGNTMSLTYAKETNRYARNLTLTDAVAYDRSGYLTGIEYGTRDGVSGNAPARVQFAVADRCLASCGTHEAGQWPDVPWDQDCAAGPCGPTQVSPTFWSTKRLATITTQVWGGSGYRNVESWTLTHSFPDPTDSISGALWLAKISHTGLLDGSAALPDVTFEGTALSNRVDTANDQYPAMRKFRIRTITSESGGKIEVTYAGPDCVKGVRMPDQNALQDNALRCYPVRWTPSGSTTPINDFFHKYVVTDVVEADLTGSSPRVLNHYEYLGTPAWHYTDDDGFIKAESKTWSVWRGYAAVRTTSGDPGEQTSTERRYFRGMHGDKLPVGTRSVVLPAIATGSVPAANDEDAFAGMERESIVYNGPGGAEVSAEVSQPWQSAPTASRTMNGYTVHARFSNIAGHHSRTTLDGGRPARTVSAVTTFDGYGMPAQEDARGDDAVTGDEHCVLTDYARNTATGIVDRKARVRTYAVSCARALAGGLTAADVEDDVRTSYDGLAWNTAPVRGDVTRTEVMSEYNDGSPTFLTTGTMTYDPYGRVLDSVDVRGGRTTTAYTPASGGPLVTKTQTNPLGWTTTSTYEPAWGAELSTVDSNGRRTAYGYDPLGRLTGVWLPGRDKAAQPASVGFSYLIRNNAPTVITTRRINPDGGYQVSYQFYDSQLRVRQTQESDGAGGSAAVVTDTYYDTAGRQFKTHRAYLAEDEEHRPVPPGTSLFLPKGTIPAQEVTLFDGAGRETARVFQVDAPPASPGGTERWRTTSVFGGDRTDTIPPAGDTVTSELTDVRGNVVERRQWHPGVTPSANADPAGYDATRYTYDRKNRLTRITNALGSRWDYAYDFRGRRIGTSDPDKGAATTTVDDAGDVVTSTDSRGVTIAYTYDLLGRKTSVRDGSVTGPKRAEWIYDRLANGVVVNGRLVKTIRWVGADQYVQENTGYTLDYRPTGVRFTIPAAERGLAGTYVYVYGYGQDGAMTSMRLPAVGDLPQETLARGYNRLAKPVTLATSLGTTYVTGTEYTSFNELGAVHLRNSAGAGVDITRTYEKDTRRLAQIWTTRDTTPTTVADIRFGYDQAGNVTSVVDRAAGDTQCFTTDHLRRLAEAWTPSTGDCQAARSASALGGPARYWNSYRYDAAGNRTQLVEHGTAAGDRTTSYTVSGGTHKLTGTSTVDLLGTRTAVYAYDTAGNTRTRPATGGDTQTLTWDPEGHLATSQDVTGTTSYLYDVDGNRMIRRDPTGKTLYLPGQELRWTSATDQRTCTRYYTHAEQTVAMRTSGGLTWLSSDHHGTATVSVAAVGQAVAVRRETPFGEQRGGSGTWPSGMDKGFVGGTKDNTGLTHLGAREYDPVIGRFISADPVLDPDDPQQMQGYAYANNTPLSASDADGLWPKFLTSVWENAGKISTTLSVIALVCAAIPIPPIQAVAAGLAAASVVFGVIDTVKSCSEGKLVECGVGALSVIPGAKALKIAYNGGKKMFEAGKGLDDAIERRNVYNDLFSGKKHSDPRTRPEGSRSYRDELDQNITDARTSWVESQKPGSWGSSTAQMELTDGGMLLDDMCRDYLQACQEPAAPPKQPSLMMIGQRKSYKPTFFCPCRSSAADVAAAKRYDQRWARFLF